MVSVQPVGADQSDLRAEIVEAYTTAEQLFRDRKADAGLETAEEALEKARNHFGPNSEVVLRGELLLIRLRGSRYELSDLVAKAEAIIDRMEEHLGQKHPLMIEALYVLMEAKRTEGQFDVAIEIGERALAAAEGVIAPDDRLWSHLHQILGLAYADRYNLDEAIHHGKEAMRLAEERTGYGSAQHIIAMVRLGTSYFQARDYVMVRETYLEANRLAKQHPSWPNDDVFIGTINNLGNYYRTIGLIDKAVEYFETSRGLFLEHFGKSHPGYGIATLNLADVYLKRGMPSDAIEVSEGYLEDIKAIYGEDHYKTAKAYSFLSESYLELGQDEEAFRLARKAIEIFKRNPNFKKEYMDHKIDLAYWRVEEVDLDALSEEAIGIIEELGEQNPERAQLYYSLGILYFQLRTFAETPEQYQEYLKKCEEFILKGMEIAEQFNFKESWKALYQRLLNSLANTISLQPGRIDEAIAYYEEALEIAKEQYGVNSTTVGMLCDNLAWAYTEKYDGHGAMELLLNNLRIQQMYTLNVFQTVTDTARVNFLGSNYLAYHYPLNVMLDGYPSTEDQRAEVWERFLWRKNITMRLLAAEERLIRRTDDQNVINAYEELRELRAIYAAFAVNADEEDESLQQLKKDISHREQIIADASVQYAEQQAILDVSYEEIVAAVDPGTVILDFHRYTDYDHDIDEWAGVRYGAFVYPDVNGTVSFLDIGSAESVENGVKLLLDKVGEAATYQYKDQIEAAVDEIHQLGGALRKRLIDQLLKGREGVERIIYSPDGALHRLPFEVLPATDEGYLVDEVELHLVSNAAQVATLGKPRGIASPRVAVFASPDYDGTGVVPEPEEGMFESLASQLLAVAGLRATVQIDGRLQPWAELPETLTEARAIRRKVRRTGGEVDMYLGADATEERFKGLDRPDILHMATHGFFLERKSRSAHPLLHAGLALADANEFLRGRKVEGTDDGILTAYEVSQANLFGTEIVVLSACETGLGEVVSGDGVYGLRRSFEYAGARTIISSLWKVPDRETSELMRYYYDNLLEGETKLKSFRSAQKELRERLQRRYGADHPFYWAAFVAVGEP